MSAVSAQSSELMDEPPIEDISFNRGGRPVSLADFPSPPSSPRYLGARHSMQSTGCRPLRSSPLAGPALRVDEAAEEVDEKRNQRSDFLRPSRVLSTPNLATLLTLPPPLRHARPRTAESLQEGFSHASVSLASPSAKPSKGSPSLFSQIRNSEVGPQLQPPPSSPSLLHSRSASSLSLHSYPPRLGNVRSSSNEKGPLVGTPAIPRRPRTAHGYPSLRHRPIATIPEKQLDKEGMIPPACTRSPKDNSWFTANTYEVTPKFSRLGLAASGVVLPVSAKEHKRLSRPSSSSSMGLGASIPGAMQLMDHSSSGLSAASSSSSTTTTSAPAAPLDINLNDMQRDGLGVVTPIFTRSSVSSRWSEESSVVALSSAAVAVGSGTDPVTTITAAVDGNGLDGSLPWSKGRDEPEPQSQKATAGPSKKKKLFRLKFPHHRASPKPSNPTHHHHHASPTNQHPNSNHPEPNEKRKGSSTERKRRRTASGHDDIKIRLVKLSWFTSSESSLSDSSHETDSSERASRRLSPVKKESSSRIRRLWKAIFLR